MARKKKNQDPPDDPEVAQAKRNLGIDPGVSTTEADDLETLEQANGLPPEAPAPTSRASSTTGRSRPRWRRRVPRYDQGFTRRDGREGTARKWQKSVVAEWKGIISQKDEQIEGLRHQLTHGKKELVRVEEYSRPGRRDRSEIFRLDTQEVLEERVLTQDESRLDLADLDAVPTAEEFQDQGAEAENHDEENNHPGDPPPPARQFAGRGIADSHRRETPLGGEHRAGPFTTVESVKCLKCMDTGWVEIQDPRQAPENRKCPNGCPNKQERKLSLKSQGAAEYAPLGGATDGIRGS